MSQLMFSFKGLSAPPDILEAVRRGDAGAFCLFAFQNVQSPAQVRALNASLYAAAEAGGHPLPLIGIDQEGGQLIAITGGATELPGNMALAATRDAHLAEQAGYVLGRELLAMGVNLNFAPSLDVNTNPENPVIGTRSFGDDPHLVAEMGVALIRGMQKEGVLASAKHFPGHGDTAFDTHHAAASIPHGMERMQAIELSPFRAAIEAEVGSILTAHLIFPALDPDQPATISPVILNGLLRADMGYNGLIISDAMDMHAVARLGHAESVTAALRAGVDVVMLGHIPNQLDFVPLARADENPLALRRIAAVRETLRGDLPPLSVVGCREHQDIAQAIADAAITVVRRDATLPLNLSPDAQIAVITVEPRDLTPADTSSQVKITLGEAVRARHAATRAYELPYQAESGQIAALLDAVREADVVIVGTINATADHGQASLVRALHELGKAPIVAAMRTPYDIQAFPMIENYLCTYSIRPVAMEALARALFGEISATGQLPCKIPGVLQEV